MRISRRRLLGAAPLAAAAAAGLAGCGGPTTTPTTTRSGCSAGRTSGTSLTPPGAGPSAAIPPGRPARCRRSARRPARQPHQTGDPGGRDRDGRLHAQPGGVVRPVAPRHRWGRLGGLALGLASQQWVRGPLPLPSGVPRLHHHRRPGPTVRVARHRRPAAGVAAARSRLRAVRGAVPQGVVRLRAAAPAGGAQAADPVRGARRAALVAARWAVPTGGLQSHQRPGPGGVHVQLTPTPRTDCPPPSTTTRARASAPRWSRRRAPSGCGSRPRTPTTSPRPSAPNGSSPARGPSGSLRHRHRGLGRRRRRFGPPGRVQGGSAPRRAPRRLAGSGSPARCACRSRWRPEQQTCRHLRRSPGTSPMVQFRNPVDGTHWRKRYTQWYPGSYQGWAIARDMLDDVSRLERGIDAWWSRVADDPVYPLWLRVRGAQRALLRRVRRRLLGERLHHQAQALRGAAGAAPVLHVGDRRVPGLRIAGRAPLRDPASARVVPDHRTRRVAGLGRHGRRRSRSGAPRTTPGRPSTTPGSS